MCTSCTRLAPQTSVQNRHARTRRAQDFREMVQGIAWPAVGGGVIAQTARLEVFTKPTVQDYVTDFVTGGRYPHPFGSDTKARPLTCHTHAAA